MKDSTSRKSSGGRVVRRSRLSGGAVDIRGESSEGGVSECGRMEIVRICSEVVVGKTARGT